MSQELVPEAETVGRGGRKATRGEICAWAMYDVANATYGTVVATAVYNAYFVNVIAGRAQGIGTGTGTLLLTVVICISSLAIVFSAPVIGTIADATASKKKMLLISTLICIAATASLSAIGPGGYIAAMIVLIIANTAFGTCEDLVAAFLPELASREDMGRISAFGWAAGYVGGLISLGSCLAYVKWAQSQGHSAVQFVPVVMIICAVFYAVASSPTFIWLRERASPEPLPAGESYVHVGFERLKRTFSHARHYRDLFSFLLTLLIYSCGTTTVMHLATVYAQEVMKFTPQDSIALILVVNVTAAVGAVIFGYVQDRVGSIKTLATTLGFWTVAIIMATMAHTKGDLWIAANVVGIAMGASGSAGRALVGQFSPHGRSGEFLGLWGVAVKLATAVGAISFGLITQLTGGNLRIALASTLTFFIVGTFLLFRVNEQRGIEAAHKDVDEPV